MSRRTDHAYYVRLNNGWISTTAVWSDIGQENPDGTFDRNMFLPAPPIPGAVVVYPDRGDREGHIAILSGVNRGIHCSKGNDNRFRDAIQETDLDDIFGRRSDVRYGWYAGLMPQPRWIGGGHLE